MTRDVVNGVGPRAELNIETWLVVFFSMIMVHVPSPAGPIVPEDPKKNATIGRGRYVSSFQPACVVSSKCARHYCSKIENWIWML
jgi:hypothetical protein